MQLIDGGMMAFACFHAMNDEVAWPLTYQMPYMLTKLVNEAQDDYAVCWDAQALWKRERWPTYRDRPEIWEAAGQTDFDSMLEVLNGLGVPQFRVATREADESLAALAHALEGAEPLLIRSDDKDFIQLLSSTTWMYGRTRGVVKPEHVPGLLGVAVEAVVDLLALTGDKVDGIPPITTQATALQIIHKHGDLKHWLSHPSDDPMLIRLIERAGEQLRLNYELVDLSADAVGRAPEPLTERFGDRQAASDIGRRLGIEHLSRPDPLFDPLLQWGVSTVEKLRDREKPD